MDMFSEQNAETEGASGTTYIDPAALTSSGSADPSPAVATTSTVSRGKKRGFESTTEGDTAQSDVVQGDLEAVTGRADEGVNDQPRKRGRAGKARPSSGITDISVQSNMSQPSKVPPRTPQQNFVGLPQATPASTQSSTPKTTPKSVIKALPTVRDHTTDQLGPEGDEYIPREFDEAGERKVSSTGHLSEGREYRCRTFLVPNRGNKLFMLATECARVLNYRDSYLLFNKNRSLYKIIASQTEKEDLIHQEILPFSYRSRQIAIVTARSMFRQFGSRVVSNGRRVRDDYWEFKALKQGFTEDDLAGDKRPGAAKAREASAAEAANNSAILSSQADITYSNAPAHFGNHHPQMICGLMLGPGTLTDSQLMNDQGDLRQGVADYRVVTRPRQELTGPPYQDRTHATSMNDMIVQAQQASDFNKQVSQQRSMREQFMTEVWHKPHEQPPGSGGLLAAAEESQPIAPLIQSPRPTDNLIQPMMAPAHPHIQVSMSAPSYVSTNHHNQTDQSPMRALAQPIGRSDQMTNSSPSLSLSSGGIGPTTGNYGYAQSQMWPSQQSQPSPQHAYAPYPQLSPQIQSAHQQSPGIRHSSHNMQIPPMQFSNTHGMPQYPSSGRAVYPGDIGNQSYIPPGNAGGSTAQNWPSHQQAPPGHNPSWPWQG